MNTFTKRNRTPRRRGGVLVLLCVILVALLTFVALAIDLGMLAVARTQLQDAADAAATAGTRTLNGTTGNNYSNASPNAIAAGTANSVLSKPIASSQISLNIGRYTYVPANQRFEGQFPGTTGNWSMVQATVSSNVGLAFSKVFNFTGTNVQATATAVHRPRDICIILDYSGSMRFASLTGEPYSGNRTSNNADSVLPTFGHYSDQSTAALQATSFTTPYDEANITTTTGDGRGPIVSDFYSNSSGSPAFSAAASGYASTPGGDNFLKSNLNTGTGYAATVQDIVNSTSYKSTWDGTGPSNGYANYKAWSGYTQGPGYWGKTFFLWPPDPRPNKDWRQVYFNIAGGATKADNTKLWNSSGDWRAPGSSTYAIDYTAILNFIKNIGPNPFPSSMQSGRIVYYTAIPSTISTSSFPPSDLNQRFWKDYIDYVLGLVQTSSTNWLVINDTNTGLAGYGTDYLYRGPNNRGFSISGPPTDSKYMNYTDNPYRPRTKFWFGPLTMVDFLGNYNLWYQVNPDASRFCWWPGTCHESPMYACKLGIRAALNDISNNHPNDLVALAMFSVPEGDAGDGGRFNRVRVGLSNAYQNMQDSLWYPPATVTGGASTVTPYDSANLEVPRSYGGTCYSMGLMQAYNQFSANTSLVNYNSGAAAGDAGGNGRRGAQKIIIFETDGAPNTTANASLKNLGPYNSYYQIRYNSASPSASEFPNNINGTSDNSSTVTSQIYNLCTQICAMDTASPPGYSTAAKKALIHCIGFGPQFSSLSGSTDNINTLNQMQILGNVTDGMPSYKIIYGSESSIAAELQQAFTQILQSGVQISLIQ